MANINRYVLSENFLTIKKGTGAHKGRLFINANKGGASNDEEGMALLGEALEGQTGTMYMISRGQVPAKDVAKGMLAGDIRAYQFHSKGRDVPSWKMALSFVTDADAKNLEYAGKATAKVASTNPTGKTKKVSLLS